MSVRKRDHEMRNLDERVAYLEGRSEDHGGAISELRHDVRDLRQEVRDFRAEMIHRFEHVDGRFAHIDTRFNWLVGLQFATLLAVIAALLNASLR